VIDRFHHIFVRAANFERSMKFYRETLGWSVTREWGGNGKGRGAILSGGGIKIVVSENAKGDGLSVHPDVFLDIHDIDARFKALGKGVDVVVPPGPTPWGTRWFVVRDPDGTLLAFEEVRLRG